MAMPETRVERAIFVFGLLAMAVLAFAIARSWHHTTAAPAVTRAASQAASVRGRTAPGSTQAAAATGAAAQATILASTEAVDLGLTASRATWIEVRAGSATGTVLYTGTLSSGTTKTFHYTAIWVRFGAASNIEAQLNDQPLRLPAGTYDAVFDTGGYHHVS
jgi:Domain of unknown function (DUF4115)